MLQSSAHKRVWQKFGGNSKRALKKNARVLFTSIGRERVRQPHIAPAT